MMGRLRVLLSAAVFLAGLVGCGSASTTLGADGQTTSTDPPPDVKDAPDVGSANCAAELLAGSQRIHAADAPIAVDLDGDGASDELWMKPADDGEGNLVQAVLSADGSVTDALSLLAAFGDFDAVLGSGDLDGDGRDEAFYALGGNTLLAGVVVEVDGCALSAVATDEVAFDYGDGLFTYPYASGGNGCAPTGCYDSVVCTAGEALPTLTVTNIYPATSALSPDFDEADLDRPIEELDVVFSQVVVEVSDGRAIVVEEADDFVAPLGELAEWSDRDGVICDLG